jgi:3-hydroxybutyryl-CoA dehydrogenase
MTMAQTIGIVGLGTMGLGIAHVYAQAGFTVLATDAHAPTRDSARDRLSATLAKRVTSGKLAEQDREATLSRLTVVPGVDDMAPCDLVIEAIVEKLSAKQALFAGVEMVVSPDAVLATNTSSLSVTAIAGGLAHPGRVLGLHFFNPAPVMRLVELVAHPGTDPVALTLARSVTEAAGKTVIICPDRPGFIVNRCARPYYGEALALLETGRTAPDIDAAMVAAGYPIGPFALIDLIGADINLAATEGLHAAMGGHPRYHVFDALRAQVAGGALGRKAGRGFITTPAPPPADAAAIALRIEAALINEAAFLHAEGVPKADIDTAMTLGLNFPRGPFAALAAHGTARILSTLAALESAAPPHLRTRYLPAPGLDTA